MAQGPISLGSNVPNPAPSIIEGPAIPIQDSSVAILKSAHPNKAALPAKQYPFVIAIFNGHSSAAQISKVSKSSQELFIFTSVSPGLPPPPSVNIMTGIFSRVAFFMILSIFL